MNEELTLLDCFVPPKGFKVKFAIATTMSQDTRALSDIIETLCEKDTYQLKTIDNEIKLALIYDNTSPQVEIQALGGLYPVRIIDKKRLLHAKMAIIKFSSNHEIIYRLIVLTGNFTKQSLNQQIEMVWFNDYQRNSDDFIDVIGASKFIQELLINYCEPYLNIKEKIDALIKEINAITPRSSNSRFIHSLKRPLYDQVLEKFKHYGSEGKGKQNYLVLGTPFLQNEYDYESFVISKFIKDIRTNKIMTSDLEALLQTTKMNMGPNLIDVCRKNKIKLYSTDDKARTLHSKYIIMARKNDKYLINLVLYIGSGNLTIDGFQSAHNIECGIVFKNEFQMLKSELDEKLFFSYEIKGAIVEDVSIVLEEIKKDQALNFTVCSAVYSENKLVLKLNAESEFKPFKIIQDSILLGNFDRFTGESVSVEISDGIEIYNTITVEEINGMKYQVMVFGSDGNPLKIQISRKAFGEIFELLKTYPNIRPESESDSDDEIEANFNFSNSSSTEEIITDRKGFSLYNFTELIEHIARENEKISNENILQWTNTLKFLLIDSLLTEEKKKLASLGPEKILILKEDYFSPNKTIIDTSVYNEAIEAIKSDWEKYT